MNYATWAEQMFKGSPICICLTCTSATDVRQWIAHASASACSYLEHGFPTGDSDAFLAHHTDTSCRYAVKHMATLVLILLHSAQRQPCSVSARRWMSLTWRMMRLMPRSLIPWPSHRSISRLLSASPTPPPCARLWSRCASLCSPARTRVPDCPLVLCKCQAMIFLRKLTARLLHTITYHESECD